MPLITRRRWILAKLEGSSYNTDPTPLAANAIRVRSLDVTPLSGDTVQREQIRAYYGANATLMANEQSQCTVEVELCGSGTAGTAPAWAPLILACGTAETVTGSAVTGTAQAGSTTTLTLASGASATNDFYNGQILSITGGVGNGARYIITDYVGSTKVASLRIFSGTPATLDNTSTYSIAANVMYSPISVIHGTTDTSITIYYFIDTVLHKFTGVRGTFSLNFELGQIPTISFTFTGVYSTPLDQATPAPTYPTDVVPQVFRRTNAGGFGFLDFAGCLQSVSFDVNNDVQYRELIQCTQQVLINDRAPAGTVVIEAPTMAQKNFFTAALDDSGAGSGVLSLLHGTNAGNRLGLLCPYVDLGQPTYQDSQGVHMLSLPYTALPGSAGNDDFRLVFS